MFKNQFRLAKNIKTLVPWAKQGNLSQPIITSANKEYIYSGDHKIVDFTSGLMVVNLGHNNKYIQAGFHKFMESGVTYVPSVFSTYERDKLSSRLCDITNFNDGKVFYTNGGTDANEVAMFITNEYKSKRKILSFKKSFHGASTIGGCLISGDQRRLKKEEYYEVNNFNPIMENPTMCDGGDASLKQIEGLLEVGDIASIIVEGSSGSAGCILYPEHYLTRLEALCRKNNVLIICDEVMSGWGRTGSLFAYQKENFNPDIITTAKGITSGYSQLGAVIINGSVSAIYNDLPILTGLTYSGHPLPCTIANQCLDLYLENDMKIIREVGGKSELIGNLSERIIRDCYIVKEYRNNGLLGCLEIKLIKPNLLESINRAFLEAGIYCYMRENRIFIAPPLIIDNDTIETTMIKMRDILIYYNKYMPFTVLGKVY
jgi:taurine---2-oxoglutarate transaminase